MQANVTDGGPNVAAEGSERRPRRLICGQIDYSLAMKRLKRHLIRSCVNSSCRRGGVDGGELNADGCFTAKYSAEGRLALLNLQSPGGKSQCM